jgi:YVTN family beta-propeller protein
MRLAKYAFLIILFLCLTVIGIIELGIPHSHDSVNIYEHAGKNMFMSPVKNALFRVYVPNSRDNTVSVIDPASYRVVDTFATGKEPQHIVPAYDLGTLWVLNNSGNSLTPINPDTGKPGENVPVKDPYNLYYTPDGKFAIVVSEANQRLDFYDATTMHLHDSTPVNCRGVNHMDFTADGKYALATCEYSGKLLKLDVNAHKVIGYLDLGGMPQDIRLSPDGKTFYVADMKKNGLHLVDPLSFRLTGFIPTGPGTHGIYPSRDGKFFYVSNRGCSSMGICKAHGPGSISVIDPEAQRVVAVWVIPNGGSPDMGNVSANGKELWLSGRYDNEVYVFDTATGKLSHRIAVGREPHGLCVWPQPGRYSLGHTGNMR